MAASSPAVGSAAAISSPDLRFRNRWIREPGSLIAIVGVPGGRFISTA
jgi:hypothetical protein